ncbi:hypothetical protein KY290_012755 [Solanum tuberosum]|uniref:Retrotransposon Copia-like N-terminal domain-containing protein n=1 Tax=Solanum tuberosum TaxID=4113 RepID=A0ABQ7VJM4_SOLTU|nr:hypothetical protein KY290_012755 [Solanum tuberosum]
MSDRVPVINAMDSSHAFYIHPFDHPGMNLVSIVFYGRSYGGCRRAVSIALSAKNKLGFIDGSLVVPTDITLQKSRSRCNDMVLSWLLNSLSKEIVESILYSQSSKVLWSNLEDRFGQVNGAKLFQLQKDLNVVIQGNSSISAYFTKMKSLWDELDALNTFSACSCEYVCGGKENSIKAHQDEMLLQFLMGLNDTFIGVRSNSLLFSPLPTIGQAYSLVIQDEKQREFMLLLLILENQHPFLLVMQEKGDFKFTKSTKYQKGVIASNVFSIGEGTHQGVENDPDVNSLSQENVAQLLQLLQKLNLKNDGSTNASANLTCAGMTKLFNSYPYMFKVDTCSRILDSVASEHITFDRSFFTNFNLLPKLIMGPFTEEASGAW